MIHGTRPQYQAGCRCVPCRASEAAYRGQLRRRHLRGLPVLGTLISPVEANRRIRQLKLEGYTMDRIARMAGWRCPFVPFVYGRSERIRLSTLLRIRRVARFAMLEGADGFDSLKMDPNNQSHDATGGNT